MEKQTAIQWTRGLLSQYRATDPYLIQAFVWRFTVEPKSGQLAESLAELALLDVKTGALALDVHDLLGLQGRHLLLHHDAQLLRVGPLVWQSLTSKEGNQQKSQSKRSCMKIRNERVETLDKKQNKK
jgi:hypothetical protein